MIAEHQVAGDVGQADQEDQIAYRDDFLAQTDREGVAEDPEHGVVVGEFHVSRDAHTPLEFGGGDDLSLHKGIRPNGRLEVEDEHEQVEGESDRDDDHADQMEVHEREGEGAEQGGESDDAVRIDVGRADHERTDDRRGEELRMVDPGIEDVAEVASADNAGDEPKNHGQKQDPDCHVHPPDCVLPAWVPPAWWSNHSRAGCTTHSSCGFAAGACCAAPHQPDRWASPTSGSPSRRSRKQWIER